MTNYTQPHEFNSVMVNGVYTDRCICGLPQDNPVHGVVSNPYKLGINPEPTEQVNDWEGFFRTERGILRMKVITIGGAQYYKNVTPDDIKFFTEKLLSQKDRERREGLEALREKVKGAYAGVTNEAGDEYIKRTYLLSLIEGEIKKLK